VIGRGAAGLAALALVAASPSGGLAAAARGERVFQRCYACHSVQAGEERLPGPNLRCVLGRRAGTRAGFEFSPAMVAAGAARGLVWTHATLAAFLADPERVVPGTTMALPSLPAPDDVRDVIDYLAAASQGCPA
jgi:cytochrome c